MFVTAIKKVEKATFPIFQFTSSGPNAALACVGTGFFISPDGIFATVAHVFDEAQTNKNITFRFWGFPPQRVENPFLEITELARDDLKDICIGKVQRNTPDFLQFSDKLADVGKSVCVSGYPMPQIAWDNSVGWLLGMVRPYIQPTFVLDDKWTMRCSNAVGKIRTHEGFVIRDFGLYGMSGGPVFDTEGNVYGVFSSVSDPRKSSNGKVTIEVQNGCAIEAKRFSEFANDRKIKIGPM